MRSTRIIAVLTFTVLLASQGEVFAQGMGGSSGQSSGASAGEGAAGSSEEGMFGNNSSQGGSALPGTFEPVRQQHDKRH